MCGFFGAASPADDESDEESNDDDADADDELPVAANSLRLRGAGGDESGRVRGRPRPNEPREDLPRKEGGVVDASVGDPGTEDGEERREEDMAMLTPGSMLEQNTSTRETEPRS